MHAWWHTDRVNRITALLVALGVIVGGIAGAAVDHAIDGPSRPGSSATSTTANALRTETNAPTGNGTTTTKGNSPSGYQSFTLNLPISNSSLLSVPQSDAATVSIIQPKSCKVTGSTVTASGTVGLVDEAYRRSGDVIELYVWGGRAGNPVQLVDLSNETPAQLVTPWKITAPLDPEVLSQLDRSSYCNVAIQSTHAFMYAGSAGG
jgi:hypothetical protein